MKRPAWPAWFGLMLTAALIAACGAAPAKPPAGAVTDYTTLVSALTTTGATVVTAGAIQQPFFTPTGQAIKVNGGDVQVFEYSDKASAEAEAAQVAPDGGSIGASMVSWVEAPHFHKAGKIILLYVGSDAGVMGALDKAMGPQFAGR